MKRTSNIAWAAKRAVIRAELLFPSPGGGKTKYERGKMEHDVGRVKQVILNHADVLEAATQGDMLYEDADRPSDYLARMLYEVSNSTVRNKNKAEYRIAMELLADELGIKDQMIEAYGQLERARLR